MHGKSRSRSRVEAGTVENRLKNRYEMRMVVLLFVCRYPIYIYVRPSTMLAVVIRMA